MLVRVTFFPLTLPQMKPYQPKASLKKNERRHSEWRLCTNTQVGLASLHNATGSGALQFVFLKF
jgi:hypothetical protein